MLLSLIVAVVFIFFLWFAVVSNTRPNGQSSPPRISGIPQSTPSPAASASPPVSTDARARRAGGGQGPQSPERANAWKQRATTSDAAGPDPSRNGRRPRDVRGSAAASDQPARQTCGSIPGT